MCTVIRRIKTSKRSYVARTYIKTKKKGRGNKETNRAKRLGINADEDDSNPRLRVELEKKQSVQGGEGRGEESMIKSAIARESEKNPKYTQITKTKKKKNTQYLSDHPTRRERVPVH